MPLYAIGEHQPILESDDIWVAPSADIMGRVVLKKGANIWFNATIRGDDNVITVGEDSNVQDGAVLHADPGSPCTIGDNTLIGIGSVILDGARIGSNVLIGANTLIGNNKEIPDGVLVLGAPGKIIRQLTDADIRMLEMSGKAYVEKGRMFRQKLRVIG
jgi:carbonic anhydrase/acetyltransferase-like protein (isoleucine patch superfamily)